MALGQNGLTSRQEALVNAALLPGVRTVIEAARLAGYAHSTTASEMLRKPIVQQAIALRRAEQADTAKALRKNSLRKAASTLHTLEDPESALRCAVMAATVEEKIGDSEVDPPSTDREAYKRLALSAYMQGFRHACSGIVTKAAKPYLISIGMDKPRGVGPSDDKIIQSDLATKLEPVEFSASSSCGLKTTGHLVESVPVHVRSPHTHAEATESGADLIKSRRRGVVRVARKARKRVYTKRDEEYWLRVTK